MDTRTTAAKPLLAISALVLASSLVLAALDVELVRTWLYTFAWWSWIVLASSWSALRGGRSILLQAPRAFALLSIWSAAFWFAFEILNLRLDVWYYVGIPHDAFARRVGMAVSFATVLPGVLATRDLLASFGLFARTSVRPWRAGPVFRAALVGLGLASLAAAWQFPTFFHPLAWGFVVFLGEPFLVSRRGEGLLPALRRGDPRPALLLLVAGLVTGLLWESWNALAAARWIYTVPFFDELKLFEMPLAGFLGFPPFALECWTFSRVLVALRLVPEFEGDPAALPAPRRGLELAGALIALAVCVPAARLVERETVHAYEPLVREIPGLPRAAAEALEARSIRTVARFVEIDVDGAPELTAITPEQRAKIRERARLMLCRGLGARGVRWLEAARVESVASLAAWEPEPLLQLILDVHAGPKPVPRLPEVAVWVRGARALAAR